MSRRRQPEEDLLFDLPLDRPPAELEPAPAAEETEASADQAPLPLAEEAPADAELVFPDSHLDEPTPEGLPEPPASAGGPKRATLRLRAAAGLADLGVCLAVLVFLLVALLAQGLRPSPADWPAAALFLLTFSFLYTVLPLAFWGRTPGMTLAGLRATSRGGRPMTFRQAMLKWLGSVLTVALAGLPLLLALGGASLSDLMSGSRTRRMDAGG